MGYINEDEQRALTVGEYQSVMAGRDYADLTGGTYGSQGEIFNSYSGEYANKAIGAYSHAEGMLTIASDAASHAEGGMTQANIAGSHAEGFSTIANGPYSHVEGSGTTTGAGAYCGHAEGAGTNASGSSSHAEGSNTIASGDVSHAEGSATQANGLCSHAEGYHTITNNIAEHACGKYNQSTSGGASVSSTSSTATLWSCGYGTSDTNRKNALEIKFNGDVIGAGFYQATSDKREKHNIHYLEGSEIDNVMRLKPCTFMYNKDNDNQVNYGFIAQDVMEVYPEMVNNSNKDKFTLKYESIISVLCKAVQEQQKEIEELKKIVLGKVLC